MEHEHPTLDAILSEWAEAMNAQALATRTIEERLRIVRALARETGTHPCLTRARQIERFIGARNAAITKWSYHTHLKSFFGWMRRVRLRGDNPMLELATPRRPKYRPRPVAAEDVAAVLDGPLRTRTRAMIMLAAFAGLRVHEIAKIHGDDYDAAHGILTVAGKGGHVRDIPLHPAVREIADQMPRRSWWFPAYRHEGPIRPNSVGYTIKGAFARAGIDMTAHQLRHAFATQLLAGGADIRVVQELMRHESIQSTALYAHVTTEQQQAALAGLAVPGRKADNVDQPAHPLLERSLRPMQGDQTPARQAGRRLQRDRP